MPDAPQSLGGFTLIERIGKGGMGEVWRAERVGAGGVKKRAAIKRITPEFQKDALLRDRFLAEARTTARFEHPNIVQVLDFGDQPELFLVLEYIEGASVADLLRQASLGIGTLPPAAALYIVAEAASGLDYAHRRTDENGQPLNIVHRDISPPNILVSLDGAVKVGDFGIARAADNRIRTQAGIAVGKLVYMAPEQARGEAVDHRADVFALGVVLWELLALRPLLPRNNPAAAMDFLARGEIPSLSTVGRAIPPGVEEIVREALAHDPAQRTSSANRMARALRTALHAIAPGFDGRELSGVVAGLLPDLHFGAPTPPPLMNPQPAHAGSVASSPISPAMANATVVDTGRTSAPRIMATREARYEPPIAPPGASGGYAAMPANGPHAAAPSASQQPTGPSQRAPRYLVPAIVGAVVLLAAGAIGAYLAFAPRASSDAPPAASVMPALQQSLVQGIGRAARDCVDRLGTPGTPGRASLEAEYDPSGAVRSLVVKVFTNDQTRDGRYSECATSALRGLPVPATREGLAVTGLAVSF